MSVYTDSEEQARVIQADAEFDILVVAGAGSGKTYTMTRRIIELIRGGVAADRILGLTFTRKAAAQLQDRVSSAVSGEREAGPSGDERSFLKPTVQTYDSFFQSIVRQYGLLVGVDQNTQPLSLAGAMQLIDRIVDRHIEELVAAGSGELGNVSRNVHALSEAIGSSMIGGDCTDVTDAVARVRRWDQAFLKRLQYAIGDSPIPEQEISTKKLQGDELQAALRANCVLHCSQLADTARSRDMLLDLVEEYAAEKRRLNLAEFGDFTIAAYQLVTRFPSIGRRYRERFSHVLLDEYQDTSTTQAALLTTLFHPTPEGKDRSAVIAVGDPFQSIYAWRGASPGAFRIFQKDFSMPAGSKPYPLSQTRRNPCIVLDAANVLTQPLRTNHRRASSATLREVDVSPLENLPEAPQGTLGVLAYDTLGQQIDGVVRFCKEAVALNTTVDNEGNTHRGSVAVLFRRKKEIADYQEALERAGLTTFVVGYSALLERPEVVDLMALLRAVCDHTDSRSLMRLLASPRFALGRGDLDALADLANRMNTESRFRTLVAAGIADDDTPRARWDGIVREHADDVGNLVFLMDVMQRSDLDQILAKESGISAEARHAIGRVGHMVRLVQSAAGGQLTDVVRAAIEALDVDIDTVVAQALRGGEQAVNPTVARMPLEAIVDLVRTYADELITGHTPTLRGFMTWLDALNTVEDEAAGRHDESADVELMSIHQSKGLEWDAVAVVDLGKDIFPIKSGDRLSITVDEERMGGYRDGRWEAPEYHETARTWLSNEVAVPAPVRVDADILPRFPHDAPVGGDPVEALNLLEDVEQIDDEVFGSMRESGDGVEDFDPDDWYLSQEEEYGRRLHADERRLAYVALTRTRRDVLLTCSRSRSQSRTPTDNERKKAKGGPSNFWQEVYDALHTRDGVVREPDNLDEGTKVAIRDAVLPPLPEGFFVGERAATYEDAVVGEAWKEPVEQEREGMVLPWPLSSSPSIATSLEASAQAVYDALSTAEDTPHAVGGLCRRARLLTEDRDLMSGPMTDEMLDAMVKEEARYALSNKRQNVTGLQALAGGMDEREERAHWRGIVRPIPRVASPHAQAGTVFHAWAERFFNASQLDDTEAGMETRDGMLAELAREREELTQTGQPPHTNAARRRQLDWRERLSQSAWAEREPVAVEQQIVASIPQLDGMVVNGKLDAVFRGGLDVQNPGKRFTIIDWKTGRRPTKPDDIARKLIQLDCYRLLLSVFEHMPLDSIDAALYYVSEAREERRELRAVMKTEAEILEEIRQGLPGQSDED